MRVQIFHAEHDRVAAAKLQATLVACGRWSVETHTDEDTFPGLDTGESTLAVLWSANLAASESRLQVETLMLDAWAEQRLVLFALDRSEFPLGFRDESFPKIDVSFARGGDGLGVGERMNQEAQAADSVAKAFMRLRTLKHDQQRINSVVDALIQKGSDKESVERVRERALDEMNGLERWQGDGDRVAEKPFLVLFVSYCRKNGDDVDRIVKIARDCGWTVWIDRKGLCPGDDWAGEIVRAIKRAKGVMWVGSKAACKSDNMKREIYLTGRHRKPLAPVLLEKMRMPDWLEYFVAGVQWLPLYELSDEDWPKAIRETLKRMERQQLVRTSSGRKRTRRTKPRPSS